MKNEELIRKLNSVGKTIFVNYFFTFKDYAEGKLSKKDCINLLVLENVSNEAGASIRCGNAILIFRSNKAREALNIISESKLLPSEIVLKAKELLKLTYY